MTQGSWADQSADWHLDIRAALRERWNLSTIPLASGLYAAVVWSSMPSDDASAAQRLDVKTEPRSEVMTSGRPNLAIHPSRRARRQSLVVALFIGVASGHLVDLSMVVNRYLKPPEEGRGPTTST